MKWFALLSLVGLVVASSSPQANQLKWRPGTEYHFEYEGRLLTGLPELSTQYSGLAIKCKVIVKANNQNKLGLTITESKYARVNNELHGDGSEVDKNWRVIDLPEFVEVPEEHKRYLAMPVVFQYSRNGVFEKLSVSQDEPEWTVNFKKALVSIFHIKYEQDALAGIENNKIASETDSASSDDDSDSSNYVDFWKTREMSLDGTCDVTYQINELPAYMIRENSADKQPYRQGCPEGSKYYGIVKTRDVSSCSKRTAFVYYKPGFFRCTTGNCEGMWSRSSITRYVACGKGRSDMRIQSVVQEGELHQNLLGFKTEKFLTGTRQELKLVHEKTYGGGEVDYPKNAVVLTDLYYEYQISPSVSTDGLPLVDIDSLEVNNVLKTNPRNMHGGRAAIRHGSAGTGGGFEPARMVSEIKQLYKELINEDLTNHGENVADKQINMKALGIARGFTVLNKTTIEHIYEELKHEFNSEEKRTVFKNVFFDTLVMGGSNSNILFIKEKILSGELDRTQIISFFTFLPTYAYTPTRTLLKSLFELVSSEKIRSKSFVYNHAVMGFTTLLQKACIADNRKVAYPTYVYGDFCNPDSDIVVNTWIPYLQRELNSASSPEKRNLLIVTLGLMSHKNVIPALVPYLESHNGGRNSGSHSGKYSYMTRMLAIYGMVMPAQKHPELVLPLVFSVFSNPAERTEVRIAAFNTILRSEPSMTVFHKIASATWREKDEEVLKVVNTALYTLSQQQSIDSVEMTGSTLPRKAFLVHPLIKKTYGEYPTSASLFTSEYLKNIGTGYRKIMGWVDSKDSPLAGHIYSRLTYFMDRYQFTAFEFGFTTRGVESLLRQIIEMIEPESGRDYNSDDSDSEENDNNEDSFAGKLRNEWHRAINRLNVRGGRRGGEEAEASFYMNFFEDSPMFLSFQSSSVSALREKVGEMFRDSSALHSLARGEEKRFDFQRVFDLAPSTISVPSDMGFPIVVEVHLPTTISVSGKMKIDASGSSSGRKGSNPSIAMEFKNTVASQVIGWVGTICPFTEEFSYTGVEKHSVLQLPVEFNLDLDVPEHKLKLRMKPFTTSGSGSGSSVDIFAFQVRPFTVRHKVDSLKPMTLNNECKTIQSRTPMMTKSYEFGELFGLNLKSRVASEGNFIDFRSVVQKLRNVNYNPMNLFRFGWTNGALTEDGKPSFRSHRCKISYDQSASTTKEIELQLQYSYGSKSGRDVEAKIHEIEVEEREGVLPYRVAARALNELNNAERKARYNNVNARLVNGEYDSGKAASFKYTAVFKGESSRHHRTLTNTVYFTHGFKEAKEKWNVHLESENGNKDICVEGHIAWPERSSAVWDMEQIRRGDFTFGYVNEIGFGHQCSESKIKVEGTSRVSEKQKQYARESNEESQYTNNLRNGNNRRNLRELSDIADALRRKYSALDEIDFTVRYENVPNRIMVAPRTFIHFLRSLWWTNIDPTVEQENNANTHSQVVTEGKDRVTGTGKYKIRLNPRMGTFNLTIQRYDNQMTRFEHVPLPYPFSYMFPVSAIRGHGTPAYFDVFTGGKYSFHPTCKVESAWIKTFGNNSEELKIDDCYHLLAGDCSRQQKTFAVMIKKSRGGSSRSDDDDSYTKEVKVLIGRTDIRLTPSERHSRSNSDVRVMVDGSEIELRTGEDSKVIKDNKGRYVAEILRTDDRVTVLKSRWVDVKFDGDKLAIEASYLIKNRLCGLCGRLDNEDNDDEYECSSYSKPEYRAARNRLSGYPDAGESCKSLPVQIEEAMESERRMCSRIEEIPTRLRGSLESQTGKTCSRHRHQVYVHEDRYCFSQQPITECGQLCRATTYVEKRIPFHCMPRSSRVSEHYAEKVREGRALPELENLKTSYSVSMRLPKACEPVNY